MGQSKQLAGTYLWGFVSFAVFALAMLLMLRVVQIRWTRTWAEKGGRARSAQPPSSQADLATAKLSTRSVRP
jgi:NNP family nitrate/nitrite transporter-like MFS transporter